MGNEKFYGDGLYETCLEWHKFRMAIYVPHKKQINIFLDAASVFRIPFFVCKRTFLKVTSVFVSS